MAAPGQGGGRAQAGAAHRGDPGLTWTIRALTLDDLPIYRPVRLRALRDHPEAFGSSFEEEEAADIARHIGAPPNVTFGGFADGALAGTAGLLVAPGVKRRHRGTIVGVYVDPGFRRCGLGRGLIDAVIGHARSAGLRILVLTVSVGNSGARRLYLDAGFTVVGAEPRGLRIGGRFIDEEVMAMPLD
jgi:ribosomal protein S18 acetylase RimI-like enzyme